MVSTKVKMLMGLHKPDKPPPPCSFDVYFPRASDVSDLLKLVEELRDRESRLKTQLLQLKLLQESASIVPTLENDIAFKDHEIELLRMKLHELEVENDKLIHEREGMKEKFEALVNKKEVKIEELKREVDEMKRLLSNQRFQGLVEVSVKSNLIKSLTMEKQSSKLGYSLSSESFKREKFPVGIERSRQSEIPETSEPALSAIVERSRAPRVPKPPPKRFDSDDRKSTDSITATPPPPPPPLPSKKAPAPPPLPPRAAPNGMKVKRIPEVVEFYHSLMRRDSRRDSGTGTAEVTAASARDLVGEIENRSGYLLAIKTDVETQGDFIRFLIKEVERASFTDIEDVVSFVKWLDDELSYLVDERAVLKHFEWPEQKADALREAAFEFSDLKKLKTEASSFKDDRRQPCASTLKKIQALFEKLDHGVYNLSRLRESASNRFKSFCIPVDWMLDTGFISQIKLASVKLAMKYMKRVSAELEAVGGGAEEEELIIQGVRFAFRVHQFAGGFDVETMKAFKELRDKAKMNSQN